MMEHRQHDLSPVVDADFYRWTGGGPAFLAFLRAELIPLIESRYHVSDQGRTILGHSLGADFAVQAILAEDSPFARCVAGSPSIFRMLEQEQVAAAVNRITASGDEFSRKIYLGCGSLEGAGDHPGLDRDLSGHVAELGTQLLTLEAQGLRVRTQTFDDQTHTSVWPAIMNTGLRWVFEH